MADVSARWGGVSTGRGFGPGYGQFQQSEPVQSRAEQYKSPGDNSSPAGRTIAAGIGTASYSGEIVWENGFKKNSAGKVTASFVMNFADCIFTSTFSLLRLFADDRLIISNESPARSSGQKIRFYDGSQTTPDPLLTSKLGAEGATSWPGMCYAVFEDFDCTDYGNRIPLIRAVLSGAVTVTLPGEEQSTLRFGSYGGGFFNFPFAVDRVRGLHYQIVQDNGDDASISTIDLATSREVGRVAVTPTPYSYIEAAVALDGSDFLACTIQPAAEFELALINTASGEIVDKLAVVSGHEPLVKTAMLLESGITTRYLVFCGNYGGTAGTKSDLFVALADVTAGTLSWIIHPSLNPAGSPHSDIYSFATDTVEAGVATIYVNEIDRDTSDFYPTVLRLRITRTGFTEGIIYTEGESGKYPEGVAVDDEGVVILREDGSVKKISVGGSTIYTTAPQGIANLRLNVWNTTSANGFAYLAAEGFAVARQGTSDIYQIDLGSGVISLLIDADDISGDDAYGYLDQLGGIFTEGSSTAGVINIVTLGDSTPNQVDLTDAITQIVTADGRFSVGDLAFTGFPGNEMYGAKLENDTTFDNLLQSIREPFDVKCVESDGKLKFIYPPRDGSFSIAATLTAADFVERGTTIIEKGIGSGEEELAACTVAYFDRDAGYKKLEQTYQRPLGVFDITRSLKKRTVNTILTLTASQAMRLATTIVYRSVLGNASYAGALVPGKAHLEPGDIIQFPFGDTTVIARITEATLKADYTQEFFADEYLRFESATITGSGIDVAELDEVSFDTRLLYLDLPLLSAAHDLAGTGLVQYALPYGNSEALISGAVYKSPEGFEFTSVGSRSRIAPVTGIITAISGTPADPFVQDETNTIDVQIQSGDIDRLETVSEAQFLAGVNLAAIGRHGRWVLIWFETVGTPADGKVELSDIMWGVRGSEVWIGDLEAGDLFVLLDPSEYIRFRNDVDLLDETLFYKGANPAITLGAVPTQAHVASGVAETPYTPVNLLATYDAGDIELSFDYRSRIADGLNPAAHGEASLAFEIDIMDGVTVKRTISAAASPAVWTAAQITADFGSVPSPFTWRAYMMSDVVGRGYRAEKESVFEVDIAGTPVLTGVNGEPYAGFTVSASLGAPPYVFSVFAGSLPSGLALDPDTGVVSGTPDTAEVQSGIVIRVTDDIGGTDDLGPFAITITETTISGTPSSPAAISVPYSFVPGITGGTAPYTFTLEAGTLPSGLSLNSSTGEISGTPDTIETQSGIEIRATDDNGVFDDLGPFEIDIVAAVFGFSSGFSSGFGPP